MRRLRRKRLSRVAAVTHVVRSNQEWALDFVCDTLATGRGIRVLAVVDAFTRENLSLEVDTSLSSRRVTRSLESVIERRGKPEGHSLRQRPGTDQPALSERVRGAETSTDPHSARTAHAERPRGEFQRQLAGRVLKRKLVSQSAGRSAKITAWRDEYNGERPHSSPGYRTPNEFAAVLKSSVMTG